MAVNPKSLKNLKSAKPGEVRNPNGRPKGSLNSATIIERWLTARMSAVNPLTKQKEQLTQLDIMVLAQLKEAIGGDTTAFNALLDRMEGKAIQKTESKVDINSLTVGYGDEIPV